MTRKAFCGSFYALHTMFVLRRRMKPLDFLLVSHAAPGNRLRKVLNSFGFWQTSKRCLENEYSNWNEVFYSHSHVKYDTLQTRYLNGSFGRIYIYKGNFVFRLIQKNERTCNTWLRIRRLITWNLRSSYPSFVDVRMLSEVDNFFFTKFK